MGDLSEHFNRSEFSCKCGCGFDIVDKELINILDDVHKHFSSKYDSKIRIIITSGCRCAEHNKSIGGSKGSYHLKGKAADFKVQWFAPYGWLDIHPDIVACYLEIKHQDRYGIGRYRGRTHVDVRSKKSRWDYR